MYLATLTVSNVGCANEGQRNYCFDATKWQGCVQLLYYQIDLGKLHGFAVTALRGYLTKIEGKWSLFYHCYCFSCWLNNFKMKAVTKYRGVILGYEN